MEEVKQNLETLGFRVKQVGGDNPVLRYTMAPFAFPTYGQPRLRELGRKFDFPRVVRGEDDFADLIELARWVKRHVNQEGRVANVGDPIEILKLSATRRAAFFCTHLSAVYAACAAAVGLPVRTIGVDGPHR